jgi:hypothetical protein
VLTMSPSRRGKKKTERASWSTHITISQYPPDTMFQKPTQKADNLKITTLASPSSPHWFYCLIFSDEWIYISWHIVQGGSRLSTRGTLLKSRPESQQRYSHSYIAMCVFHSPHIPPLAVTTISYSLTATHTAPVFVSTQITSQKHASQVMKQI